MNKLNKVVIAFLVAVAGMTTSVGASAAWPANFGKAKAHLLNDVYGLRGNTFYCGCEYYGNTVDHFECGYKPRKNKMRSKRLEWEHVMPAWEFGHQLQCWQEGGRKECQKDPMFLQMESDMHNLVPSVGEVNGDRSNYRYGMIEGETRVYGACDAEVDFKQRVMEPRDMIRGDVARTYFYMSYTYGMRLSDKQAKLFTAWDKLDPIDEGECERDRRIAAIQGTHNPYVSGQCQ